MRSVNYLRATRRSGSKNRSGGKLTIFPLRTISQTHLAVGLLAVGLRAADVCTLAISELSSHVLWPIYEHYHG